MNINCLRKIRVGEFVTLARVLASKLPNLFAEERDLLTEKCDEIEYRLNADRINYPLRELMNKCMPKLRSYIRFLTIILDEKARNREISEKEEELLREIRARFKHRRKLQSMLTDIAFLTCHDAPEAPDTANFFAEIKRLAQDMEEKNVLYAKEEARIKSIRGSIPVRNEAMDIIRRIKERACAALYEKRSDPERYEAGAEVVELLNTITHKAKQFRPKKRKKKAVETEETSEDNATNNRSGEKENAPRANATRGADNLYGTESACANVIDVNESGAIASS